MKRIAEQIKELQARIPQQPELLVVTWNGREPRPEPPPGYQGRFLIITRTIVETGEYVDVDRVAEPKAVARPPVTPPEQPPVAPRRTGLIYR